MYFVSKWRVILAMAFVIFRWTHSFSAPFHHGRMTMTGRGANHLNRPLFHSRVADDGEDDSSTVKHTTEECLLYLEQEDCNMPEKRRNRLARDVTRSRLRHDREAAKINQSIASDAEANRRSSMPQRRQHQNKNYSARNNHRKTPTFRILSSFQEALSVMEMDQWMDELIGHSENNPNHNGEQGEGEYLLTAREQTNLIRLLGSQGAHDTMLRYLDHLSTSSLQTSLQANGVFWYTAAIGALTKSPKYRGQALGLLDEMDRLNIAPNAYTFTALFTGIHGRQNTLKLMERASSYGKNVEWNIHFYNAAIHACSRQHPDSSKDERHDHQGWQTALTIFRQMQQQDVEPNDQTYTWLLHACAKSGQARVALSLLEELRASGTRPSEAIWGAALRACAMAGNYMEAMNLIQTMQRDPGGVPPSTLHYNTLLSALAKTGQDSLAYDILQSMQSSTTPSKNISVQQQVSGSHKEASVEMSSIHEGARPDIISLNTVLAAFAKAGNYDGARKLISRMEDGEFWQDVQNQDEGFQYPRANRRVIIQPDVISYNTLLSACSDPVEAVKIVKEMRMSRRNRYGATPPTKVTYTNAISVCRKLDPPDLDTALQLLDTAKNDGIAPNVYMYSAAIWTAERLGDWRGALSILNEMKSTSVSSVAGVTDGILCEPNEISYDGVISACASHGLHEEAIKLYKEMKDKRIVPTPVTYQKLAAAINRSTSIEHKQKELEEIFNGMKRYAKCIKVGGPIIELLIREYAAAGQYQAARRVFDSLEGPVNAACLAAILYACFQTAPAQWEDAIILLHSSDIVAGATGIGKIESIALNYAIMACAKENHWEEAMNLIQIYCRPMLQQNTRVSGTVPSVSVAALNSIISASGRSGRPDIAVQILNEMDSKYGILPDERSYRSAIIACNQAEHERQRRTRRSEQANEAYDIDIDTNDDSYLQWWECSLSLLRRMKEEGLSPDPQIYSSAISACEAAGEWQRALGVLRSMPNDGDGNIGSVCLPNLFCFNAAIAACEKGDAWVEALELYERMKNRGGTVRPNFITVNSILIALDKAGQPELAQDVYNHAIRDGILSPWKCRTDTNGKKRRVMDLHQFSGSMATIAVRSVMESMLSSKPCHDPKNDLILIVGKGLGSEGNVPVLRPKIQQQLQGEFCVHSDIQDSNTGRLHIVSSELQSFVERKRWR